MDHDFISIGNCSEAGSARAVGLILLDHKGRLILQLRDNWPNLFAKGCWCIFGGGVDDGEDPKTACLREVSEELGLVLNHSDIEPYSYHLGIAPDFDPHFIFVHKGRIRLRDIQLGEGAGFAAFDKSQLEMIKLSPNLAPAILHYASQYMTN